MNKNYLASVQALRGIAAILVLIGHVLHEGYISWGAAHFYYPFGVGVHIFFVISGFVIAYNSPKFFETPGGIKKFLWRRVLRVIPLYWIYLSLMLLALTVFPDQIKTARYEFWHVLQSYLFIPHINPAGDIRPILSLGWTLNYEMYFYLIFAVFMILPRHFYLKALTVFFIVSSVLWFFIPHAWTAVKFWTSPIILEFLAGAWIGHLYSQNIRLPGKVFWPLCLITSCAFVGLYFTPISLLLLVMGVASILLVLTVTLPIGLDHIRIPKFFMALGDSSYSLYLSHAFTIGLLGLFWSISLKEILNPNIFMLIVIIVATIVGHWAYWLVEKSLLRILGDTSRSKNSILRT